MKNYVPRKPWLSILILGCLLGCDANRYIDPTEAARILKMEEAEIYESNAHSWAAKVEVVFSQPPVDLKIVDIAINHEDYEHHWEQIDNIMTLYLTFRNTDPADAENVIDPSGTYKVELILNWSTGRKQLEMMLKP